MKISDRTRTAIKADGTRIPVVDGKLHHTLQPNEDDIKNSKRGSPSECMYVLCVQRQFGSEMAYFTRGGLAYIELRGPHGKPRLERYMVSPIGKAKIKDFDAGKEVTPEAIQLSPPVGVRRLGAQSALYQRRREQQQSKPAKGKAWVKGNIKDKPKGHEIKSLDELMLRNSATGKFHFTSSGNPVPKF